MKVGYVVKRYPRFSETFIVNEILAHEEAGLELEIFALLPSQDSHFQNLLSQVRAPVIYLPQKVWKASEFWERLQQASERAIGGFGALSAARGMALRDTVQAFELSQLVRAREITHMHAHFASAATAVARLAARMAGVPYTFTAHAKDIFHDDVDRSALGHKLRDAAASITVSDYNLAVLREEFGASATKLQRIYNGLNLDDFPFVPPTDASKTVLAIGRLVEKKGFGFLLEACALLRDRGIDFHCLIVGSGETEAALRAQIDALSLDGIVSMPGALPQTEVKRLLRDAAVFAAPCVIGADGNRDGLPTVLLEAMAMGLACVATPVTGIPEVVIDGETGLLVSCGSAAELADAIVRLLADASLRARLALRARRLIEERFDVHTNAALIRDVFFAVTAAEPQPDMELAL